MASQYRGDAGNRGVKFRPTRNRGRDSTVQEGRGSGMRIMEYDNGVG